MVGFDVTPTIPSSSTRRLKSPLFSCSRSTVSYQTLCPCALSWSKGFVISFLLCGDMYISYTWLMYLNGIKTGVKCYACKISIFVAIIITSNRIEVQTFATILFLLSVATHTIYQLLQSESVHQ